MSSDAILELRGLRMEYLVREGTIKAVNNVDLDVPRRSITAIIGESGSGKTSLVETFLRILPKNARIYSGKAILRLDNGQAVDLITLPENEMRKLRGKVIGYVPQGAQNSLNPVLTVWQHFKETLAQHGTRDENEIRKIAEHSLKLVGLDPDTTLSKYPHELSGGMKQRVVIALTMSLRPKLVVLDEPTSALDVFSQRIIVNILDRISREIETTMILITHDVPIVAELADYVSVLYAGQVVEAGPVYQVFNEPLHPYTRMLINSIPSVADIILKRRPTAIPGEPPSLLNPPPGCKFHPRCPFAMDICRKEEPPTINVGGNRYVKCWLYRKS